MKTKLLLVTMLALSTVIASGTSSHLYKNKKRNQQSQIYQLQDKANRIQLLNKSQAIESGSVMKLDSIISYYYEGNSAWVLSTKSYLEYRSDGKLANHINLSDMMGDGSLTEDYKFELIYDENGNISKENYYSMDTAGWDLRDISSYNYDEQGRMTELSYSWKEDGEWIEGGRGMLSYSANLTEMTYEYKDDEGIYQISEKIKLMYSNDILTTTLYYDTEEGGGGILYLEDSGVHIANAQGQITEEYWYYLDDDFGGLVLEGKYEYTYDNQGNPTLEEGFEIDTDSEKKALTDRYVYTYNTDYEYKENYYNIPSMFLDMEYSDGVKNLLTSTESGYRSGEDQELVMDYKQMYIYSETEASLRKTSTAALSLYPNPTSDYIRFKAKYKDAEFHLLDLQGRIVLNETINAASQISVRSLQKGLYIYTIRQDKTIESGNLLIK